MNMYYAVLWYLIKEGSIEYLKDIAKNAEEHLIYRFKNSYTMASLIGLAQFVTTRIPTDLAVWYCVNSGFFNMPTNRDTFRFHVFNINPMIDMCKVFDYPLIPGTQEHIKRTQAMLCMLQSVKKHDTGHKRLDWKTRMQCLYQKGIKMINIKKINKKFAEFNRIVRNYQNPSQATSGNFH
jgi:hypothetical protein